MKDKLIKNSTTIKQLLFVFLASVLVITSLTVYILSIVAYEGGFDANVDYLVYLILSIIILIHSIYGIVRPNGNLVYAKILTLGLVSSIGGLYSLGQFFKKLTKGYDYVDIQLYLYMGIICLILVAIALFEYLETKKQY